MFSWTSWREKNETFWRWDYGKQWNICFFLVLDIFSLNLELCQIWWIDTEAGSGFTSSVSCIAVCVSCCTHTCKHGYLYSIYLSTYGRADEFYFAISLACFYVLYAMCISFYHSLQALIKAAMVIVQLSRL